MTNGEKLCRVFPQMKYTLQRRARRIVTTIGICASFDLDWWNAEYEEPITENCIACKYDETEEEDGEHCKKCLEGDSQFELDNEFVEATIRKCFECNNHNVDTEKCHLCMWENQYTPTTKNDLGDDCISRADLYNRIKGIDHYEETEGTESDGSLIAYHTCDWNEVLREIEDAPSVIPQQRIGKWIKSRDGYGNNHYTCPFCEHDIATKADIWGDNYCSNCGAKLQESEDKE